MGGHRSVPVAQERQSVGDPADVMARITPGGLRRVRAVVGNRVHHRVADFAPRASTAFRGSISGSRLRSQPSIAQEPRGWRSTRYGVEQIDAEERAVFEADRRVVGGGEKTLLRRVLDVRHLVERNEIRVPAARLVPARQSGSCRCPSSRRGASPLPPVASQCCRRCRRRSG